MNGRGQFHGPVNAVDDLSELQSHDHALPSRTSDPAKPQIGERRLPTHEGIRRSPLGLCLRPPFDSDGTLVSSQRDRGSNERGGEPLPSMLGPKEHARHEPDTQVLVRSAVTEKVVQRARVARSRTAGAPTDRLPGHERQDPHRHRAARGQLRKVLSVSPEHPAQRKLAPAGAEGRAPAATGVALGLEEPREVGLVLRADWPGLDVHAPTVPASVSTRQGRGGLLPGWSSMLGSRSGPPSTRPRLEHGTAGLRPPQYTSPILSVGRQDCPVRQATPAASGCTIRSPSAPSSRSKRTVSPSCACPDSTRRASWSSIVVCTSRRSGRAP